MNIEHVKIQKIGDVAMVAGLEFDCKMNINIECVQKEMGDVAMIAGSNSVVNIEPFFFYK